MNPSILVAIRCSLMFLVPSVTYAISAQWDLDPISGDWNTVANWTPDGVPNSPADVATLGLPHTTDVSISANTEVNGITFTAAATNPYTITASPGLRLTLSGIGITNNSGTTQNFVTAIGANGFGSIVFTNSATAGNSTMFSNSGGSNHTFVGGGTVFRNTSTAGDGTFINNPGTTVMSAGGRVAFADSSTAGNAPIINLGSAIVGGSIFRNFGNGVTVFNDNSTAANATFINNGGVFLGGVTIIQGASAGNATFINNGGPAAGAEGGLTRFNTSAGDTASAENGTFINNGGTVSGAAGGSTSFLFSCTAENGTFINNGAAVTGAGAGFTQFDGATAGNGILPTRVVPSAGRPADPRHSSPPAPRAMPPLPTMAARPQVHKAASHFSAPCHPPIPRR